MPVGSVGFIYFHFLRPLPPPRANKELYFYVHYFRTIFEFLSPVLEGRFLWEWWLFRIFLRTKLSFFLTARQSESYRKHWKETQEKERRKVRAVSTKCWDNARLRTVSLFCWCVEQNAQDTQMTTGMTDGVRQQKYQKRETNPKARENGLSQSCDFLAWKLKVDRPNTWNVTLEFLFNA